MKGPDLLPGTAPLIDGDDLAMRMLFGIHAFLDRAIDDAVRRPDGRSAEARRRDLAWRIGAVDPRVRAGGLSITAYADSTSSAIARGTGYEVHTVRWPVFDGVDGEGLMLRPTGGVRAAAVVLDDPDAVPEVQVGLVGKGGGPTVACGLATAGCLVFVPVLVDCSQGWSGHVSHREYVWRMAFEMGRHIIGYEVQKVLALVDHCSEATPGLPIGVYGCGEGGLLALHAGALDTRIAAVGVNRYFQHRAAVWREPPYRDIWGQLRGFGDADLAGLIAPRGLMIGGHPVDAAGDGATRKPSADHLAENVRAEVERAATHFRRAGAEARLCFVDEADHRDAHDLGASTFLRLLTDDSSASITRGAGVPRLDGELPDPRKRAHRQFRQLCEHTQRIARASEAGRSARWAAVDRSSGEAWEAACAPFRDRLSGDVVGRCPPPELPPNPRSRLVYAAPQWRGYELTLDVWPGVFAYGILLLPNDIGPGERRPVVVCQHGLEGRAQDVVEGRERPPYHGFAARLVERGFIAYAPQNPYLGGRLFRTAQRKAHAIGWTLFAIMAVQHARTLAWLASQPWVDAARIGLYGVSYGGQTVMRLVPLLPEYRLAICSADFNEWVVKCTSEELAGSFLEDDDSDMYEFGFGTLFNYSELAGLIAPRPFMVERGHDDGAGADEWVAYEYAKVRRLYAQLGIADRTAIEFFPGGHAVHCRGTFAFLDRHLRGSV